MNKIEQIKNYEGKEQKGITLIALVITIIILLILAGITINLVLADGGIFNKTEEAVSKHKQETAREKLFLAISILQIKKQNKLELSHLIEINDKTITVETSDGQTVTIYEEEQRKYAICIVDGYKFKVYDNLEIVLVGEEQKEETPPEDEKFNLNELGYIEDGLIVLYDGEENTANGHDSLATVWTNLANETCNGELINIDYTETSGWTDNSLILDGVNDWVRMEYLAKMEEFTIEIVLRPIDINAEKKQYYVANAQNGGAMIYKPGNNKNSGGIYIGGEYKTVEAEKNVKIMQKYSLSLSYDKVNQYFSENGIMYQTSQTGTMGWTEDSTVFVLGTNPNGKSSALLSGEAISNIEIYSVRIYNRCLSSEEIMINYDTDVKRFDIKELEMPELGYIKDGMISMYDGEYNTISGHRENVTVWEDISGNENIAILNNGTWRDNYLYFDKKTWVNCGAINYSNITIEVVCLHQGTTSLKRILGNVQNGGYGMNLRDEYNNFEINIDGTYYYVSSDEIAILDKKYSLSSSYNGTDIYLYENGKKYYLNQPGTIKNTTSSTIFVLGANPKGSSVTGEYLEGNIYCVRIYNRTLTEEEVKHNYEIDKARFGIAE